MEDQILFSMKSDVTFYSSDIESAMKKVADHLVKVATDENYDGTIFESGNIEIKKVTNENNS
jgi:hypothetical protein